MSKPTVDYSLYLVTDSSLLPPGASLASHVQSAILGGCTIVQLREKTLSTAAFISLGIELHAVTRKHNVPLLINDRVDVALAVGCEGVHIGWDDISYTEARRLLGPDAIIGLSVSDEEQAKKASKVKPDYLGLGPIFATATKPDHNPALGVLGARDLLCYISELGVSSKWGAQVPIVGIGGLNITNAQRVLFQTTSAEKKLAGIAVVSAIIASLQPEATSMMLQKLITLQPLFDKPQIGWEPKHTVDCMKNVWSLAREAKPMVHHITNNVVKSISANITLAAGGSPIMSEDMSEASELAAVNGALVVNMGTSGSHTRELFLTAIKENNSHGNPVVFDPVGGGATSSRRQTVKTVLEGGYCDIIKGNLPEISTVAGESVNQRGVDSSPSALSLKGKVEIVEKTAKRLRNIVVMTGVEDIISSGSETWICRNGHEMQGLVTGTGCSLGSVIGVLVAASRANKLLAVLAAVTGYNLAAERAAVGAGGPGTWRTRFVDEIWNGGWDGAKVEQWVHE